MVDRRFSRLWAAVLITIGAIRKRTRRTGILGPVIIAIAIVLLIVGVFLASRI
jgi:hypothetical protein